MLLDSLCAVAGGQPLLMPWMLAISSFLTGFIDGDVVKREAGRHG